MDTKVSIVHEETVRMEFSETDVKDLVKEAARQRLSEALWDQYKVGVSIDIERDNDGYATFKGVKVTAVRSLK
jgi:hypothetical protein